MIDDDRANQQSRVDGRAKVTGAAKYVAEFRFPGMAYGFLVQSTIAKGTIREIDTAEAEKQPGVIKVVSHKNATKLSLPERPVGTIPRRDARLGLLQGVDDLLLRKLGLPSHVELLPLREFSRHFESTFLGAGHPIDCRPARPVC